MPSEKTNRVRIHRTKVNKINKTHVKTRVARVRSAVEENAPEEQLNEAYREACSALDRAARKGTIHRNTAARKKSRLAYAIAETDQ